MTLYRLITKNKLNHAKGTPKSDHVYQYTGDLFETKEQGLEWFNKRKDIFSIYEYEVFVGFEKVEITIGE